MNIPVLPLRHIVKTQPLSVAWIEKLFESAEVIEKQGKLLENRLLYKLFYQPSTRTRTSFEVAMLKLGGQVVGFDNAERDSSAAKGESLEDTIRVACRLADVIVLRHYESSAAERAAGAARVPIINAGCGRDQHPTQALLDLYTIWRHRKGNLNGLRVAMMGDLKNARAVRSLSYLLGKYAGAGVKMYFVSPWELRLENDMLAHFEEHGIKYLDYRSTDDIIDAIDVLYVTRTKYEEMHPEDNGKFSGSYQVDGGLVRKMRDGSIIMAPGPRSNEISLEVDRSPKALYLTEQIDNGVRLRMALLADLLAR